MLSDVIRDEACLTDDEWDYIDALATAAEASHPDMNHDQLFDKYATEYQEAQLGILEP